MYTVTYKYRVKDGSSAGRALTKMAKSVNTVWNFCKESSISAAQRSSCWTQTVFNKYWLHSLTGGSSKLLGLHSQTVQSICEEYFTRRTQFKKFLRWRNHKSLGWIPFKAAGIKIAARSVSYCGHTFKTFHDRQLPQDAQITNGCFAQDARGRWYITITFKTKSQYLDGGRRRLGCDLGLKTLLTSSDPDVKVERLRAAERYRSRMQKIEMQRKSSRRRAAWTKERLHLPKSKQYRNLNAKIANIREDHLHKGSSHVVRESSVLIVGALNLKFMHKNRRLSASSYDASIGRFAQMLRYKASRAGVTFLEVNEAYSTQQCSECSALHPTKLALSVREWVCQNCGSCNDRDINAARNILAFGESLLRQKTDSPPVRIITANERSLGL